MQPCPAGVSVGAVLMPCCQGACPLPSCTHVNMTHASQRTCQSRSFSSSPSPSPTPSPHRPSIRTKGEPAPPPGKAGEKSVKKPAPPPAPPQATKTTAPVPEPTKPGDPREARRKERQARTPPRR
ncbi:hypothetical protein P7K49_036981 [Saguinus oedipus]|uniref:Uncharacterized protein n=1 Tax=Saguinus oedipus TaxID=9490 RepID=A0ABQ9TLP1_SAGOE|nr:hypothetical protein P7K49_036981 [Saguinus oedipus]